MSTSPARRPARIPYLRDREPVPAEYAHLNCYTAGYLVSTNANWRNIRPVVDAQACNGCLKCYMHCPDGAIYKTDIPTQGKGDAAIVAIDCDFCKGCGICARMCAFDALSMISEKEAQE